MRVLVLALVLAPFTAVAQPSSGSWFTYEYERIVDTGGGAYAGYSDRLYGTGRYEVTEVSSDAVSVHADYSWSFSSAERHDRGAEDRNVQFALSDRHYLGATTDLDDYDDKPAQSLATWMWITPTPAVGDSVQILDHTFTMARYAELRGRRAVVLEAHGTDIRNDEYGRFDYTWDDTYWFDAATGLFIRSEYREHDIGFYEGRPASFLLTERVEVLDASYHPERLEPVRSGDSASPICGALFCLLIVCFPIALIISVVVISRSRGSQRYPLVDANNQPVILRVTDTAPRAVGWRLTKYFEPFLAQMVAAAQHSGDRVVVAFVGGEARGLGIQHKEAGMATIFAEDTGVTEGLRQSLGCTEWFSEVRHPVPPQVRMEAQRRGAMINFQHAYNELESYRVLSLSPVPEVEYDADLVSRARSEDMAEIAALAQRVYRVPSRKWLDAQVATGDVLYVAKEDGRVVGFGLMSLAGAHGRLHALTVAEEARGRGIAKELTRARVHALRALGATSIITEIAHWNLASTRVAEIAGFAEVGTIYVESSRDVSIGRKDWLR